MLIINSHPHGFTSYFPIWPFSFWFLSHFYSINHCIEIRGKFMWHHIFPSDVLSRLHFPPYCNTQLTHLSFPSHFPSIIPPYCYTQLSHLTSPSHFQPNMPPYCHTQLSHLTPHPISHPLSPNHCHTQLTRLTAPSHFPSIIPTPLHHPTFPSDSPIPFNTNYSHCTSMTSFPRLLPHWMGCRSKMRNFHQSIRFSTNVYILLAINTSVSWVSADNV